MVGEVLQAVSVVRRIGGVVTSQLEAVGVIIGVVLDPSETNARQVEESVHQVRGEVVAGRRVDDAVSERTELLVVLSVDVREVTDDSLLGGVLSTPVAPPSILDTVWKTSSI